MSDYIAEIRHLSEKDFKKFKKLIYNNTGIFLKDTKVEMINSRLLKRLRVLNIVSFHDYYDYLENEVDGAELLEMINCITTNKTDFFRENNHFEFMNEFVLPEIRQKGYSLGCLSLRIWSSACSTGEEPYTIGMLAKEFFKSNSGWNIRILASDLDTNVLKKANEGIYSQEQVSVVPIHLLKEYFYKGEGENKGYYKVKEQLKAHISFNKINLIDHTYPINSPLDIIFCRNVFIYFDHDTVNSIIDKFYNYLKPGGYLFLGHSESIDTNTEFKGKFRCVAHTVYERI